MSPAPGRGVDDAGVDGLTRLRPRPPVLARVPRGCEVPFEMHADDGIPLLFARREQHAIAEEPRVVDEYVEGAERFDAALDEVTGAFPIGDVVGVRDGFATRRDDLVDNVLGRSLIAARPVARDAEVVDDDLGAFAAKRERMFAADPTTGSGDDDDTTSAEHGSVPYLRAVRRHDVRNGPDDRHGGVRAAVEDRGLYSLYLPEHTHIPTSRMTPPPTGDAELADEYKHTLDPFVALGIAAAVTERLVVGTGICLVAQREPIVTAKAIATLDQQSGGRFVLGMGFGWNADEAEHHGVAMATRREHAREHLLAMRALWREEAGRVSTASSSSSRRRGRGPSRRRRTDRPCSSVAPPDRSCSRPSPSTPTAGSRSAAPASAKRSPRSTPRATRTDRDPQTLRIVPFGTVPNPGKIEYYASLGIEEIVLRVPSAGADRVLPLLDRYAELVGG